MLVHLLLMRFPNGLRLRLHKTGISMHSALKEEILLMIYILSEMPTDMERLSGFKADAEIFTETTVYDYEVLARRLREQAFS